MARLGCLTTLTVALLAAPLTVAANDQEDAERLFSEGQLAFAEGRFADARDLYRRSLDLFPHASTAFNLGVALRGTGEMVEATRTFDRLIAGAFGDLTEAEASEARALRQEVANNRVTLEIRVCGPERSSIRLDGVLMAEANDCLVESIEADPGRGVVSVAAAGFSPEDRNVDVEPGRTLALRIEPRPVSEIEPSSSVFSNGWFWVGTGAVVVAAVVLTVLFVPRTEDHVDRGVLGEVITLRAP